MSGTLERGSARAGLATTSATSATEITAIRRATIVKRDTSGSAYTVKVAPMDERVV